MSLSYLVLCILFFVSIYGEEPVSIARKATKSPKSPKSLEVTKATKATKATKVTKASKNPKSTKAHKSKVTKIPKAGKSTKVSDGNYKIPLVFEYDCDTTDPPPTTSPNFEPALLQYHEFVNENSNQGFTSIGIVVTNHETSECTPSTEGNGRRLLRGLRRTFVSYNLFALCFVVCPVQALPEIDTANRHRFLQSIANTNLLKDIVPFFEQFKLIFLQQLALTVTTSTTDLEETTIIDCSQPDNCYTDSSCCGTSDCACSIISDSLCRVNQCVLAGCCESFNAICFTFPSCPSLPTNLPISVSPTAYPTLPPTYPPTDYPTSPPTYPPTDYPTSPPTYPPTDYSTSPRTYLPTSFNP